MSNSTKSLNKRKVALVGLRRADRYPLDALIKELTSDNRFELALFLGESIIEDRNLTKCRVFQVSKSPRNSTPLELANEFTSISSLSSKAFGLFKPDILIVLGDRTELLGICGIATIFRVPIAHLHGGETTIGSRDDFTRSAVSRLAQFHFCSTSKAQTRLIKSGISRDKVFLVGAIGIDRLKGSESRTLKDLERVLDWKIERPFGLLSYHPPTIFLSSIDAELVAIKNSLGKFKSILATHPGEDPGSDRILNFLLEWEQSDLRLKVFRSIGDCYPIALKYADLIVGNSSSGIFEAGYFGTPVIDIGHRQRGREHGNNVIAVRDASTTPRKVERAVNKALSDEFRNNIDMNSHPYKSLNTAKLICDVLASINI